MMKREANKHYDNLWPTLESDVNFDSSDPAKSENGSDGESYNESEAKIYEEPKDTWGEYFSECLAELMPNDDLKKFHPNYFIPFSIILLFLFLGIFLAAFVPGYLDSVSNRYLSPINLADPDLCEEVTLANTGTFLATRNGYWQGSKGFDFSNSTYQFSMTSLSMTREEYARFMADTFVKLKVLGKVAERHDLTYNIMLWMTYVITYNGNAAQRFTLSGDPLVVFNRDTVYGALSSDFGDCRASSQSSFDKSTGRIQLRYDMASFFSDPAVCSYFDSLDLFGYSPYDPDYLNIETDIRSLVTALAINMKITQIESLEEIDGTTTYYQIASNTVKLSSYFDPEFPSVEPIWCATYRGNMTNCFLQVGGAYALPLLPHGGISEMRPTKCDCSTISSPYLENRNFPCNRFKFMVGFLYYPTPFASALIHLLATKGMDNILENSYNAMFIASRWGFISSSVGELPFNETTRVKEYDFCRLPDGTACYLVTYTLFDAQLSAASGTVSNEFAQLQRGACRDTVSTDVTSW
jgi:hypothetical protein